MREHGGSATSGCQLYAIHCQLSVRGEIDRAHRCVKRVVLCEVYLVLVIP